MTAGTKNNKKDQIKKLSGGNGNSNQNHGKKTRLEGGGGVQLEETPKEDKAKSKICGRDEKKQRH